MRRPPYHRDQRGRLDVKMTPMIDVIFLLLIFFVCTANFQAPEEVLPTQISLPGTVASRVKRDPLEEDLDEIVVHLFWRDGRARWQINEVDYEQLTQVAEKLAAIRSVTADLPVILDVEPAVPMEHVIDLYDLCRRVGLRRVQFAASVGV